ncbi:MAG: site-2 protease family protein [Gemmatimonadota bacterium]
MDSIGTLVLYLPVLLLSVVLHEYAHARVALAQGDQTPLMLGRVTMNPLAHLDPVGSLLVPLLLWVSQAGFLFGWARPVKVNSRNFRNYRRGDILVSLAGVAANFLLAFVCLGVVVLATYLSRGLPAGAAEGMGALGRMARFGVLFNILLGVFNLIPIPPLDGSHVLYHLLSPSLGARYRQMGQYGIFVLIAVFFVPGLLSVLLSPVWLLDGLAERLIRLLV